MKVDLKKQCDPKFRVKRTNSSKDTGLQKPVHEKLEVFNRSRIFSVGSIRTSKLACMSILKWIGPFLNPWDKNVFSEMSLWAGISKNQFFFTDFGSFRTGRRWGGRKVIFPFSSRSDEKRTRNRLSKCANFCKIWKVSTEIELSDETGSSFDQMCVIGSHWGRNWKIFKMADNGPTVCVRDVQKGSKCGFLGFIP